MEPPKNARAAKALAELRQYVSKMHRPQLEEMTVRLSMLIGEYVHEDEHGQEIVRAALEELDGDRTPVADVRRWLAIADFEHGEEVEATCH